MLQPWDTMSLRTADLDSVCVRARFSWLTQTPQQNHPLSPLHEPLHGELNATGSKNAFSAVLSTEGGVVGPCWAKLKPKGPKGDGGLGFGVCASAILLWINSNTPTEPPTIPSTRVSAWRAKRDPEAKMLSLQSFLRKGVSLGHVGRN